MVSEVNTCGVVNEFAENEDGDRSLIDIDATSYTLNTDADAMFEIKRPDVDIRIRSMVR